MPATPESSQTAPAIILETTVLSNFARIRCLPLLERLYGAQACTTLMVVEEIRKGIDAGYSELDAVETALPPNGWLALALPATSDEQALYLDLLTSLGRGEASCLALARMRQLTLATDDRAARRKAAEQNVPLTGTLGILIRLVRQGLATLEQGNGVLATMIQKGYYSPVQRLDDFV